MVIRLIVTVALFMLLPVPEAGAMIDDRERTNSIELGSEKADVRWHGQQGLRRR